MAVILPVTLAHTLPWPKPIPAGTYKKTLDDLINVLQLQFAAVARDIAFMATPAGGGFPDAPADGTAYGRENHTWQKVLPLAGGGMTGSLLLAHDPTALLEAATKQYVDGLVGAGPSTTLPLMDAIAAVGTGVTWARADHVHPSDTSRAPLASPTFTGTPAGPTPAPGTSTTQLATTAFVQAALAGAGVSSVTAGTGLTGGGTGAVTLSVASAGITNALLATMPTLTLKGNNTGATGAPLDLTTAQVAAMLNLAQYAPLASPTFTGTPAGPTATPGTNTTQLATTAFIQAAITALGAVPAPSSTLPLMDGTAAIGTGTTYARADHIHPSDTSRAPLASPTLTGTPAAPTAAPGTNTTQLATTAFIAASFAPLASPTLTGTPAAPTATAGTSTTQLATTAFVQTAIGNRVPSLTPQQVLFGAASGGGAAQSAKLLWNDALASLILGTSPSIARSIGRSLLWDLALNAWYTGTAWSFDDTTKSALDIQFDQTYNTLYFRQAPPSANPPIWQNLMMVEALQQGTLVVGNLAPRSRLFSFDPATYKATGYSANLEYDSTKPSGSRWAFDDATTSGLDIEFDCGNKAIYIQQRDPGSTTWNPNAVWIQWPNADVTVSGNLTLGSVAKYSVGHRFRYYVSAGKAYLSANSGPGYGGSTWQSVSWNALAYNTDGMWTSPGFTVAVTGYYQITFALAFNPAPTADLLFAIFQNASAISLGTAFASYPWPGTLTAEVFANVGDSFTAKVNTGPNITLNAIYTWMSIHYVGE